MAKKKFNQTNSKVKRMDDYLYLSDKKITSDALCQIVHQVFQIKLDEVPVLDEQIAELVSTSQAAIDFAIQELEPEMTGEKIRKMLNRIFGINLDGISSLEGERISLYSKDQWMIRNDEDIIEVRTGPKDVDVQVGPTTYFSSQPEKAILLESLGNKLSILGYQQKENEQVYYYVNQNGEPVSDPFKGETMRAIAGVIREHSSD